jgi:hypothetical protein
MHTVIASPRPTSFWVIAVVALLWNLLGVVMFVLQVGMSPETLAALPADQRSLHEATPPWVNIAFGVAVFGGVLGALGLLMKKCWAVWMFLLSLLGLVVQLASVYAMTPAWQVQGPAGAILPVVLVLIAAFLWWYARKAAVKGWIA